MKIGYARCSTPEQEAGMLAQLDDLKARGCDRVFNEFVSAISKDRPQLEFALQMLREGDEFIITKLDRVARNIRHLLEIVDRIKAAGATLQIIDQGVDTNTIAGRLILGVFGLISEFERDIMKERQKIGTALAKKKGVYKKNGGYRGKRKVGSVARNLRLENYAADVLKFDDQGIARRKIHLHVGCSENSVRRVLRKAGRVLPPTPKKIEGSENV